MAYKLIVVGASLGGLRALQALLGALPERFGLPLAVVQHRQNGSDETLCGLLQSATPLCLVEPEDKEPILAGHAYLAPPDYHLLVEESHFALSLEAPVCHARPSIDVLFQSAALALGEAVIGIILTGANEDGAQGLAAIKRRGGLAVVQDPETAEARAMPDAALAATEADTVLPLEHIGPFLVERLVGRRT